MPKRLAVLPTLFLMLHAWAAPRPTSPILKAIEKNPYALVNVTAADMPASPDVLQLGKRSTQALSRCLADNPDANLRADCASMLGTLGDVSALATLHVALEDWEPEVRLRVIQALGQLADHRSTQPLIAAYARNDETNENREAVLKSLGALGDKSAIAFLRKILDGNEHRPTAFAALWRNRHLVSKGVLIDEVDSALRSEDGALQYAAALKAAELRSPKLVKALVRHIDAPDANLRNKVIRALGLIGDKRAEPALLALLPKVRDARLLNNVAFALERIDRPAFFAEVQRLITHKQAVIRMNAAFVVGDVQRQDGAALLQKALSDPSDRVRLEAIEAAGKLPEPAPLLLQALHDDSESVRLQAVTAGEKLRQPLPLLTQAMRDASHQVRHQAVVVASTMKQPPAPLLISALNDPDPAVQRAALDGIAQSKLSLAIPALQPFLADPKAPLYEPAVYALHELAAADPLWSATRAGSNDLIHDLLFASDDAARRHRAALTLAQLGDGRVHDYAVDCLFGNRCALPDVAPLLVKEADPSVIRRLELVWARGKPEWGPLLVKLRAPGLGELARADLELRGDADLAGVLRSTELLVDLGETSARPQVVARLDRAGTWQRLRLLLLLGRLGESQAAARVGAILDELPVEWLPDAAAVLGDVQDPSERKQLLTELTRRQGRPDYHLALAAAAVQLAWQPRALPPRLLDGVAAAQPRERELSRRYLRRAAPEGVTAALTHDRRSEVREELQRLQ
jgi:HEAT repeat protein